MQIANSHHQKNKKNNDKTMEPPKRSHSLLEDRIKDFLDKSKGVLNEKKEPKGLNNVWITGTRSKSEDKLIQIGKYQILKLNESNKKPIKRPLSVNLSSVIKGDEKEFIQKQLLYKRMKIDRLLGEGIGREINSIFRGREKKRGSKKMTSFQNYIDEKRRTNEK